MKNKEQKKPQTMEEAIAKVKPLFIIDDIKIYSAQTIIENPVLIRRPEGLDKFSLLWRGYCTILVGDAGDCKSTLARSVVRDASVAGFKTLWLGLDGENLAVWMKRQGVTGDKVAVVSDNFNSEARVTYHKIVQMIQEFKPDIIVLDSLASSVYQLITEITKQDPDEMMQESSAIDDLGNPDTWDYKQHCWHAFINELKKLCRICDSAMLILHHSTKLSPVQKAGNEPFTFMGSQGILSACDLMFLTGMMGDRKIKELRLNAEEPDELKLIQNTRLLQVKKSRIFDIPVLQYIIADVEVDYHYSFVDVKARLEAAQERRATAKANVDYAKNYKPQAIALIQIEPNIDLPTIIKELQLKISPMSLGRTLWRAGWKRVNGGWERVKK